VGIENTLTLAELRAALAAIRDVETALGHEMPGPDRATGDARSDPRVQPLKAARDE
jgi:hypothetical protein